MITIPYYSKVLIVRCIVSITISAVGLILFIHMRPSQKFSLVMDTSPPPHVISSGAKKAVTSQSSHRDFILQKVPFFAQAPFGQWSDPRQQDACEETSSLMAVLWAKGKTITRQQARETILDVVKYEGENFETYHDTSAQDTLDRIIQGYFGHINAQVKMDITTNDIRNALYNDAIVIVPVNGQKLANPHYTAPGPIHHMLLIIGYDPQTDQFITNDPGTTYGKHYRYSNKRLAQAMSNYPTGNHELTKTVQTAMIIVKK